MAEPNAGSDRAASKRQPERWLFWTMVLVVMLLFVIFSVSSFLRLDKSLDIINSDISSIVPSLNGQVEDIKDENARIAFVAKARAALEHDVMLHRHKLMRSALATRSWTRFMSLIFGIVLVVNGSVYVLGRVTAPLTRANIQWQEVKVSLASSSPGLVLAFLGCILMAIPNLAKQQIDVKDTCVYMQCAENAARAEIPESEETRQEILNHIKRDLK